jgi:hypothetical protein
VFIDLAMVRTGGSFQVHYYDYAPSNPVATTLARRTLAHASVDTGSAIAPDVLQVDYTATTAMSRTACRLQGGGTGYRRSTKGTITYGQFGIDTTTSPFFGVLASAGTQARLTLDPGCGFGGDPGHTLHQCTGHVELSGGTTDGSLGFAAADNYGRTHVFEAAGGGGGSDVKSIGHVGFETGPITNLPRPRWTATGAAAHLRTGAGVLMTGSATFTSHRAPVRSAVKRCLSYGRIHSFRVYRYLGRLTPDATPLAALFDTGTLTLPGTVPGALRVLVYSS